VVETPWFRQMYLGQWVIDSEKLVYRFNSDRNTFAELPTFTPASGTMCSGWILVHDRPPLLCARTTTTTRRSTCSRRRSTAVGRDQRRERIAGSSPVRPRLHRHRRGHKQAVEEMRRRHELPLRAADKTGKSDFVEIMNGSSSRRGSSSIPCAAPNSWRSTPG